jgi:uncharacterized protein
MMMKMIVLRKFKADSRALPLVLVTNILACLAALAVFSNAGAVEPVPAIKSLGFRAVDPLIEPSIPLVKDGVLTEVGLDLQNLGIEQYQSGLDALAMATWRPLAEQGHGESQHNIAVMLSKGAGGIPINNALAMSWYERAAASGYAIAMLDLGFAYFNGTSLGIVEPDIIKSAMWLQRCADVGNTICESTLGQLHVSGDEKIRNIEAGLALLQRASAKEDPTANSALGVMYLHGRNYPQDFDRAYALFKKAIDRNPQAEDALFNLGLMYDEGYGRPKDIKKAVTYYSYASLNGKPEANNNLGMLYRNGHTEKDKQSDNVGRDYVKARAYFQKASEQGNTDAVINLADMQFLGHGIPKNQKAAVEQYKKLALVNNTWGQCRYAQALRYGDGVPKDTALAEKLAEQSRALQTTDRCEKRLTEYLR